jgi:Flp pilus assembly protein TadB
MEFNDKEIIDVLKDLGALKLQVSLHETSNKELYDRVGRLEKTTERADEVVKSIKCSVDEMKSSVNTALSSFSEQLKKLQLDPGENWKLAKRTILTSIVTFLVVGALGALAFAYFAQNYENKYQQQINELKQELGKG